MQKPIIMVTLINIFQKRSRRVLEQIFFVKYICTETTQVYYEEIAWLDDSMQTIVAIDIKTNIN